MNNNTPKAWRSLIAAGLLEILWAYFMKLSHGFTLLIPSVIVAAALILSFFLLGKAVEVFGIGLSYAVFTGIGIAGTTAAGILFFHEEISIGKIFFLILILIGIIGLKLNEGENTGGDTL